MNYKDSPIQSMHAVESLQLNGVAALHLTMPHYYRQHLQVITLSPSLSSKENETVVWIWLTYMQMGYGGLIP